MRTILWSVLLAMRAGAAEAPALAVTGGEIRGSLLEKGGAAFKGIPFAQPPVGELRWREPMPVKAWNGLRDATAFGPPCAQNGGGRMLETSKEDCLFLNVWTPEWPARSRMPVMVWIHGGGNYGGTASNNNFDGESLARHGVVLVSTNYRLTVFGFFAHPELTKESPHHASGNYGLLDQIAALQWVRENIAKFGGDPGNVTIFGQSAGAVDVNVLMTSPLAKGLFHRAIAESGTVTRNPDDATLRMTALGAVMQVKKGPVTYSDAAERAEAEQAGEKLGASLHDLRAMSAADLLKAAAAPRQSIGPANGVAVDGWVIPRPPAEVFATAKQQRVPLLIGNNARERTPHNTPEEVRQAMDAMYGPLAAKALTLYPATQPPDPLYGAADAQWVVDTMYRCPVVAQLLWHAAGNPSYEYQFDRAAPGREELGAVHGAEVSYVFGTVKGSEADAALSGAIQRYWTNFAKTGDPNGAGLPHWPLFDANARAYMEFTDNGPQPREGLRRPYCDVYVENVKRLMH
ncbi:MAG: carboxylesterase family protein [Terriglobia bacterium]|nr:MAG: carboxylesterase family protein [Terriglobia bacterium]